ncbi:PAN2-PAN3 deadenylation complex subunit PAN3 [Fulvia fulva]|uniref:PAN2-PAN3 deadenylation complex subunit PAN3 n=1 Tax=Passalora fulva TaxID=5499 RepID=A0A9Q8L9J7_PASFU|nr:PAN2-PAN3 deadenylation complex subunit PAN3 [Fulvia fulva]KAK4632546.1 PAN2-PAN3 deadenylation complex subunit PAN3 [Fulvia fulva]UJO13271.1 PAN2-PAN3 deadenylation complex subunit PAN3 [Fulvia fulva]
MSTMSGGSMRIASNAGRQRYENRAPINSVLCRNGPQCRKHLEGTCNYNHDFGSGAPNGLNVPKKSLNVESPSFTPKPMNVQPAKIGISPKAASAAAFTPRGSGKALCGDVKIMLTYCTTGSVTPAAASHSKEHSGDFNPQMTFQPSQQFQEFILSQSFLASSQVDHAPQLQQQLGTFGDPFLTHQSIEAAQLNPYAQQAPALGGQPFFQDASSYKHPLNYHLYASIGPRRENLMPHQRSTADFFLPDNLREELQQKSEATLQTFANSTLPMNVEYFHSLVALDSNNTGSKTTFGYPSWIYKADSSRDGHVYALRRIAGFRLTDEACIRTINHWKRISNSSIVQIHDAFTGRWFNDSSLIIVTDYHPKSQTLAEKHFSTGRTIGKASAQVTQEGEIWGYIVQMASAMKTIHDASLAAQTITPSKVLLTSKNRVRLGACGILDILHHGQDRDLGDLQRNDLRDLGRLILGVATRNVAAHQNILKALEQVSRSYSERLRSCIAWLLIPPVAVDATGSSAPQSAPEYNIAALLTSISDKVLTAFDSVLHLEDDLTSNLMRELENGRLARLLAKLNVILERPDTGSTPNATTNPALLNQPGSAWSETGERYYLKLFRDFVFHQVDPEGRPVLDLGHIVTCLNKLDAGIDEKIQLISRDEQSMFIVSYKEVKRGFEAAWAEISKASNPSRR